ncbi:formyltransferase family protein [Prochlorococcus sp. MIT 0916]|uniref:formyltransferase family protein n=1 Tax=Prochlorococcus sp. MIT 0916 TaxID=3082521 RepID=UPI0039B62DD0
MKNKKVLLIGNRNTGFDIISKFDFLDIVGIAAVKNSELNNSIISSNIKNKLIFSFKDREELFNYIKHNHFDILLTTGCPFILPISKIKNNDQLFINAHPSLLPKGRGVHPINEILLMEHKYYGASLHYIEKNVDSGNIIYQKKYPISSDINLDLLYYLSFQCEKEVIAEGLLKLKKNFYNYFGKKQIGNPSSFKRSLDKRIINFKQHSSEDINRVVKAFGIRSQGVYSNINGRIFKIYETKLIKNNHISVIFKYKKTASICLEFDGGVLIKTINGYILITNFEIVDNME